MVHLGIKNCLDNGSHLLDCLLNFATLRSLQLFVGSFDQSCLKLGILQKMNAKGRRGRSKIYCDLSG